MYHHIKYPVYFIYEHMYVNMYVLRTQAGVDNKYYVNSTHTYKYSITSLDTTYVHTYLLIQIIR